MLPQTQDKELLEAILNDGNTFTESQKAFNDLIHATRTALIHFGNKYQDLPTESKTIWFNVVERFVPAQLELVEYMRKIIEKESKA